MNLNTEKYHVENFNLAIYMEATVVSEYEDYTDNAGVKRYHALLDFGMAFPHNIDKNKSGYPDNYKRYEASTCLKYHLSWDWLFKVIEKISLDNNEINPLITITNLLNGEALSKENLWKKCSIYATNYNNNIL